MFGPPRLLIFEGRRAKGIVYSQNGREHEALAHREVLLCAGAIQSPQLLQLSGIGDAASLKGHGIAVLNHLPGVGQNLQDHLQVRIIHRCAKPVTTNDDMKSIFRKIKMGLKYILFRSGPLSIGINQAGAFVRTVPGIATPDIQFHFAALSADMPGAPLHEFSGFTSSVCQLRPESRGTVMINSRDPFEAPAMQPNYLSSEIDRKTIVAGLKVAREIATSPALNPYIVDEYMPGKDVLSSDELLEFARNTGVTIFHPSGTCKMGSDHDAVVDDRLRVHGAGGLRVIDCSIMPTLVSGNTHAPVVMIAEKAADMVLDDVSDSG